MKRKNYRTVEIKLPDCCRNCQKKDIQWNWEGDFDELTCLLDNKHTEEFCVCNEYKRLDFN